ncbi:MAG: hypothetical protein KDB00_20905 [Planctomycetales bacterium]|nr:hypothetical protein [Planctomycetales bacterium]
MYLRCFSVVDPVIGFGGYAVGNEIFTDGYAVHASQPGNFPLRVAGLARRACEMMRIADS